MAMAVGCLSLAAYATEPESITIGTGGENGLYYPTGSAICNLVNRTRPQDGLRCLVQSTAGSVYNLNRVRSGELSLGIAQSDAQFHAMHGLIEFAEQGPDEKLRAVFSLHGEPFTVVARADSGIKTFDDLKGKRVNIGNPGSGQRATLEVLMAAKGWTRSDFALSTELKPAEQSQALCDNKVDAIVYTVGHPNSSILEATLACDSVLVEVRGPAVDPLVQEHPYYAYARIPGGMYRGNPEDINSFGVVATLVTSANISENTIYTVVKSVFENFEDFRGLQQALADLTQETMIGKGNSAPLHPGAIRYYREIDLLA